MRCMCSALNVIDWWLLCSTTARIWLKKLLLFAQMERWDEIFYSYLLIDLIVACSMYAKHLKNFGVLVWTLLLSISLGNIQCRIPIAVLVGDARMIEDNIHIHRLFLLHWHLSSDQKHSATRRSSKMFLMLLMHWICLYEFYVVPFFSHARLSIS